jgi:hypothetical protein
VLLPVSVIQLTPGRAVGLDGRPLDIVTRTRRQERDPRDQLGLLCGSRLWSIAHVCIASAAISPCSTNREPASTTPTAKRLPVGFPPDRSPPNAPPECRSASAPFTTSTREPLQPPDDLNALERAEFVSTVLGSPPNHFQTSDVATLAAYARCVIAEKRAAGELDAAPVIDGKAGREASKTGEDKPEPIVSAFERLAMEAYRDDRRN